MILENQATWFGGCDNLTRARVERGFLKVFFPRA
jgi:hypothetical protein